MSTLQRFFQCVDGEEKLETCNFSTLEDVDLTAEIDGNLSESSPKMTVTEHADCSAVEGSVLDNEYLSAGNITACAVCDERYTFKETICPTVNQHGKADGHQFYQQKLDSENSEQAADYSLVQVHCSVYSITPEMQDKEQNYSQLTNFIESCSSDNVLSRSLHSCSQSPPLHAARGPGLHEKKINSDEFLAPKSKDSHHTADNSEKLVFPNLEYDRQSNQNEEMLISKHDVQKPPQSVPEIQLDSEEVMVNSPSHASSNCIEMCVSDSSYAKLSLDELDTENEGELLHESLLNMSIIDDCDREPCQISIEAPKDSPIDTDSPSPTPCSVQPCKSSDEIVHGSTPPRLAEKTVEIVGNTPDSNKESSVPPVEESMGNDELMEEVQIKESSIPVVNMRVAETNTSSPNHETSLRKSSSIADTILNISLSYEEEIIDELFMQKPASSKKKEKTSEAMTSDSILPCPNTDQACNFPKKSPVEQKTREKITFSNEIESPSSKREIEDIIQGALAMKEEAAHPTLPAKSLAQNIADHDPVVKMDTKLVRVSRIPDNKDISTNEGELVPAKKAYMEPFISKDPLENKDNEDPRWELLRSQKTDDERYRYVKSLWQNVLVPDPNLNMTHSSRKRYIQACAGDSSTKNKLQVVLREVQRLLAGSGKRRREGDDENQLPPSKRRCPGSPLTDIHFSVDHAVECRKRVSSNFEDICFSSRHLSQFQRKRLWDDHCKKQEQIEVGLAEAEKLHKFYSGLADQGRGLNSFQTQRELREMERLYSAFRRYYNWAGNEFCTIHV